MEVGDAHRAQVFLVLALASGEGRCYEGLVSLKPDRKGLVRVRDAMPQVPAATKGSGSATATIERPRTLDPEAQAVLDRLHAGQGQSATAAASPIPNKIEPAKTHQRTKPGRDRGPER